MTVKKDPKRVDATPARRFFVSMLIRDIELIPAIIDLVDNSADGAKRMRKKAKDDRYTGLFVNVEVSPDRFVIEDNCGGMDVKLAREYAFKFGRAEDAKGPIGEVGQFGIGMKRALFKMGEKFTVASAAPKSRFTLPVKVPEWTAEKTPDWSFRFKEVEEGIKVPKGQRIELAGPARCGGQRVASGASPTTALGSNAEASSSPSQSSISWCRSWAGSARISFSSA